jgi:hypothetical protein
MPAKVARVSGGAAWPTPEGNEFDIDVLPSVWAAIRPAGRAY